MIVDQLDVALQLPSQRALAAPGCRSLVQERCARTRNTPSPAPSLSPRQVVKAFLTHDLATLEQHCGPELMERFSGIFKHFETEVQGAARRRERAACLLAALPCGRAAWFCALAAVVLIADSRLFFSGSCRGPHHSVCG